MRDDDESRSFASLPDVLTPGDLCEFLPVGRNAVYDLLSEKKLASIRIGRKLLIPKMALAAFLGLSGESAFSPT